jgi:hypothetical protein
MVGALEIFENTASMLRMQCTADQYVRDTYSWAKVFPAFRQIYKSREPTPISDGGAADSDKAVTAASALIAQGLPIERRTAAEPG